MKKAFVILITVALLGILAASIAPGQKSTAKKTTASTTTASASAASATAPRQAVATTATGTPATSPAAQSTSSQYKDGTFTGSPVSNYYDNIQVAVTISGGKITAVDTPVLNGDSGRSQQINSYAIPQLKEQVISTQSSKIDGVSGASYTTQAYVDSLQSALDQAKA